jgi:hypothetical protein
MLSDRELKVYQALDGKQHRFVLLNVDVHDHSKLLAKRKPQVTKVFYKLAEKFFQLAVDLNHGIAAPWQGDGGFAIFCTKNQDAFNNAWNAASDFLIPFQNSILRNLERECGAAIGDQWRKDYPQFYCVIDSVEFVYDYNQPGTWCGAELSQSLKEFKKMARPNILAITKRAYSLCKDQEFWKSKGLKVPNGQKIYFTKTFGQELIISNPDYRDRIYQRQADNIAARNMLTEFLIEKENFSPNQFLMAALHCLAKVFRELDHSDIGFRASVWRKRGGCPIRTQYRARPCVDVKDGSPHSGRTIYFTERQEKIENHRNWRNNMKNHTAKNEGSVLDRPDYKELSAFNAQLLDEKSHLGKIISSDSLRKGSAYIQQAIAQTIVNNGHGAMIKQTRPRV